MSYVNQPMKKKDAEALVTGQPVYTDDLAPKDCLIVKVLRSPHAHAMIEEILSLIHISSGIGKKLLPEKTGIWSI